MRVCIVSVLVSWNGGVVMENAGRVQLLREGGRYLRLEFGMVGENMGGVVGADDQRRRDVECETELERGGDQFDAVATGDGAQGRQLVLLVIGNPRYVEAGGTEFGVVHDCIPCEVHVPNERRGDAVRAIVASHLCLFRFAVILL